MYTHAPIEYEINQIELAEVANEIITRIKYEIKRNTLLPDTIAHNIQVDLDRFVECIIVPKYISHSISDVQLNEDVMHKLKNIIQFNMERGNIYHIIQQEINNPEINNQKKVEDALYACIYTAIQNVEGVRLIGRSVYTYMGMLRWATVILMVCMLVTKVVQIRNSLEYIR
ncbi:hypothetical protein NERG_00967 [Nematocida ausubeli]|uniref:Uncharacterized protein n=1 Tax=Nematocida ausubeli (strain ATCC PRA-371 / ERTm2) TaxID=1913371 RepID=H8ZBL8_NEMA1|nr:hypothetical protein NERG_00967 [Nematocida ausubeli]